MLLRNGLIAAVGKHVELPKGATMIDGSGHTLVPGPVGMHDRLFYPAPKVNPAAREVLYPEQASSFPKPYLAGGVTTIRATGRHNVSFGTNLLFSSRRTRWARKCRLPDESPPRFGRLTASSSWRSGS